MAIKFLKDHEVGSFPPEKFTAGQVVTDRSPESEAAFVRRNAAAFIGDDKKLYDIEGREVVDAGNTASDATEVEAEKSGSGGAPRPDPKDVLSHEMAGLKRKK